MRLALTPEQLRRTCDPARFTFDSTAELAEEPALPGQERARDAIEFSVGIRQPGYNLFVVGSPGVGRRTLVERLLANAPPVDTATLRDWCYVDNFKDPQRPVALSLPPGRGPALRDDLEHWVTELRDAIPAAFDTDEYRDRLGRIDTAFNERQQKSFGEIGDRAALEGIALLRTPTGFSFAPLSNGQIMTPEEFGKLPEARQKELAETMRRHETELEATVRQVMLWRRERAEAIRVLNGEVVEFAVGRITADLRLRYADLPAVAAHLDAAKVWVIEHVDEFRKPPEQAADAAGAPAQPESDPGRYHVNLVVSHEAGGSPPIVFEDHPTYPNLVGRVEYLSQMGALVTNFGLIRAGSLHRANGGYLLVDAEKLLMQPYAWEGLKRALRTRELRIDSLGQIYSLVSTLSLEPQPIPLDLKVVLFGTRYVYAMLNAYDPDFGALFKVAAEFDEDVLWTDDSLHALARMTAAVARRSALRPFSREAVAALAEECARMAEDATRLSVHARSIEELLQQADYWAGKAGRDKVDTQDIEHAVSAQETRTGLTRDRMHESVLRGIVMIDTDGAVVGQVNGLAVFSMGSARFALPQRITATTRFGRGEVIDIHREIALSGALHSKGVLTMSSFLATRFGRRRGMSLSATLSFEQAYGMIDGDSASVAELCALLSSLSGEPVRQDIAITGSANQMGQVQAIGGVNEKIEGFHAICKARGFAGKPTVIIPASNREHLMLRREVVESVRAGRFAVHAITHVDEAIELLTGVSAGAEDSQGVWTRDSINARVAARLAQFERWGMQRGSPGGIDPRRHG